MKHLFEIGTEELPAGEIPSALAALAAHITSGAAARGLKIGRVSTLATPRRLTCIVDDVAQMAAVTQETITGPSARVAFDDAGNPTRAAEGFARGQGVEPASLVRVDTPKGAYVAAVVQRGGEPAAEILAEILHGSLACIQWRRSMRWGWGETAFSRPIHWVVALLDGEVLDVNLAGVQAGRTTYGHRFLAPDAIELAHAADYVDSLHKASVMVDLETRRAAIRDGLAALAKGQGLRTIEDAELLEEVVHLVEWPVPMIGRFDEGLLELPREVLITSMRSHQRYFALERSDGTLANAFAFVSNMRVPDPDIVVQGNVRVLRARLEDARFFYREDRKRDLASRCDDLHRIVYIQGLGSVFDRSARIAQLSDTVSGLLYPGDDAVRDGAIRAARLSKADLSTGMVGEFPELQGTMGRRYATADGEPEAVAQAIEEHYRPRGATDAPANAPTSVVVAIADRIDTLAGCFALGLVPSGSADPFALRRAALGILRTLVAHGLRPPLRQLVRHAIDTLPDEVVQDASDVETRLTDFVLGRLRAWLAADFPTDVVDAVVAVCEDDIPSARARCAVLADMRERADFDPLAAAFKRVVNMLRKAHERDDGPGLGLFDPNAPHEIDVSRFSHENEHALAEALTASDARVRTFLEQGDFQSAANEVIALKPAIDDFFDAVLVDDPDPNIRINRLRLLARIRRVFLGLADISTIQVAAQDHGQRPASDTR